MVVNRCNFHEEVVRMLTIDNWSPERSFSLLKKLRISPVSHRRRFQTEHGAQRQRSMTKLPLRHWHEPVGGEKLIPTARPGLLHSIQKKLAMKHEIPVSLVEHEHFARSRAGFHVCTGDRMFGYCLNQW